MKKSNLVLGSVLILQLALVGACSSKKGSGPAGNESLEQPTTPVTPQPSEPTDPGPVEPTPTEPTEPSEPTLPTEPSEPAPPAEPEEPTPVPPTPPAASCGNGYTKIAANTALNTTAFCIARFEMKDDGTGQAVSQASGTPKFANKNSAQAKCADAGGRLPTNTEWNAIALEIHSNLINWANVNGQLKLITGVHALWASPLSVSDESNGYDQVPGGSTATLQRRQFVLASGESIWDFGGNVWEWVETSINGDSFSPSFRDNWGHRPQDTYWFPGNSPQLNQFFPFSGPYDNQSLGVVFGGTTGQVIRGAGVYMFNNDEVGIFTAAMDVRNGDHAAPRGYSIDQNLKNIGFRCVKDL